MVNMSQSSVSKKVDSVGPDKHGAKHFDAEALGSSFQKLAVDVVKGEKTDFLSRWYRSPKQDADLVIWTDGQKRIIKHQLCFFGQVVDWNPINGTRTGLVVEEEIALVEEKMPAQNGKNSEVSEKILFDKITQLSVVDQALKVLSFVPDLPQEDRDMLLYNLRQSPKLHKKARERALETWAPKMEEIVSTQRPTFWLRLKSWVLGD
jgi:hypothetical protein